MKLNVFIVLLVLALQIHGGEENSKTPQDGIACTGDSKDDGCKPGSQSIVDATLERTREAETDEEGFPLFEVDEADEEEFEDEEHFDDEESDEESDGFDDREDDEDDYSDSGDDEEYQDEEEEEQDPEEEDFEEEEEDTEHHSQEV